MENDIGEGILISTVCHHVYNVEARRNRTGLVITGYVKVLIGTW
jgi:hypothetical protein